MRRKGYHVIHRLAREGALGARGIRGAAAGNIGIKILKALLFGNAPGISM